MDTLTHIFINSFDAYNSDAIVLLELVNDTHKKHFHYADAIIDLHQRGYCQDFVLFGNELLWVQEKIFISNNDFSIFECHQFGHSAGQLEDVVILGIMAKDDNIKGILMNHYKYTSKIPEVIIRKLDKLKPNQW